MNSLLKELVQYLNLIPMSTNMDVEFDSISVTSEIVKTLSIGVLVGTSLGLTTGFSLYSAVIAATGAFSAGIGIAVGVALLPIIAGAVAATWDRKTVQLELSMK